MFSLKAMFGREVKVTYEPDYQVDSERPKEHFMQIVGKRGTIWAYSDTEVSVETTHRVGKKLIELFGARAKTWRDTDEGIDVIIPLDLIRSTFRYIKPRRIRQLSEATKQALRSRLASFRPLKSTLPAPNTEQGA